MVALTCSAVVPTGPATPNASGSHSDVELVGVELVFPTLGVVVVLLHGDIVVWDATLPHATAEARLLDRDVAGVAEQEKVASKRVPTGTPKQDEHIISLGRIIGDRWVHSFFVRDNARYKHTWIM